MRLRKWVEILLYVINVLISMFIVMVNDFDLVGAIIYIGLIGILFINTYIIYAYGGHIKW